MENEENTKLQSKMEVKTRDMLKNRPHSTNMKAVAEESKLNVNWLYSFESNSSGSYGAEKVETLFLYLGGKFTDLEEKESEDV